jgi:2-oxoglutarate ferredoxin oxidoreductase subunit delta
LTARFYSVIIYLHPKSGEEAKKQMKYWRKPLDLAEVKVPHGILHILKERCKGCNFCIEFCPRKVLVEAEEFNTKGYHPPRVVDEEGCASCGLCEMLCPEFAIYRQEELKEVVSLWGRQAS